MEEGETQVLDPIDPVRTPTSSAVPTMSRPNDGPVGRQEEVPHETPEEVQGGPMDHDGTKTADENENPNKKTRNRSRSKKTAAKKGDYNKPIPNIDDLLHNLKHQRIESDTNEEAGEAMDVTSPITQSQPPSIPLPTAPQPPSKPSTPNDPASRGRSLSPKTSNGKREGKGGTRKGSRPRESTAKQQDNDNSYVQSQPTPSKTGTAAGKKTSRAAAGNTTKKQNDTGKSAPGRSELQENVPQQGEQQELTGGRTRGAAVRTHPPLLDTRQEEQGNNPWIQTHNRQWTRNSPSSSTSSHPSGEGKNNSNDSTLEGLTTPAGNKKSDRQDASRPYCLDVTSHRFIPEDDTRIDILLRRIKGDDPDRFLLDTGSEGKTVIHNYPTIYSNEVTGIQWADAPGACHQYEDDDRRYVSVQAFVSVERPDTSVFHVIARRPLITFLMVFREKGMKGSDKWIFPPFAICQDFINEIINKCYSEDNKCVEAYNRSGKWGKIQTIILSSSDVDRLTEFRRLLTSRPYRGYSFDTFPKDAATVKADINILLRSSMKMFDTELIPKVLFSRNADLLAGTLRVLATRFFTKGETSHKGESKDEWRSVELKGNEQFMRCLRFIPESKPFLLGYDTVQLRGGLRPDEPTIAGAKRSWRGGATGLSSFSPSQHHQQQQLPAHSRLLDPQTHLAPPNRDDDNNTTKEAQGSNRGFPTKRGRPFRGGRRGRYPRK